MHVLIIIDVQGSGQLYPLLNAYLNKLHNIRLKVDAGYTLRKYKSISPIFQKLISIFL